MKTLVSVVVPLYNEQDNVAPLAEKILDAFAPLSEYDLECILVNDGSTDQTGDRLAEAQLQDPRVRPLTLVRNSGQSAAVVAGMRHARGEFILTLDGDLQNDPADFPRFLELLKEFDCVCGYRANRNDTWVRRVSSRVANAVRNAVLHDGIRDSGCGSKGFRRHCVQHLVAFNGVHRFLAVFMRAQGFSIVECPVLHHPRHSGVSKYGINNRLWRGLYDLVGVAWLAKRQVVFEVRVPDSAGTAAPRDSE
ncbi:MAG: glycosyltransferase family 2 protein [Candidatus Hydrogenedentes bacterium]|nr:glycosyltransferase family 2 protein [Candidatus Hydrogenedentota bacterium]